MAQLDGGWECSVAGMGGKYGNEEFIGNDYVNTGEVKELQPLIDCLDMLPLREFVQYFQPQGSHDTLHLSAWHFFIHSGCYFVGKWDEF